MSQPWRRNSALSCLKLWGIQTFLHQQPQKPWESSLQDRVPWLGQGCCSWASEEGWERSSPGISWCLRMMLEFSVLGCVWGLSGQLWFILLFSEGDLYSWLSKHSTAVLQTSQTCPFKKEKAKNENIYISDRYKWLFSVGFTCVNLLSNSCAFGEMFFRILIKISAGIKYLAKRCFSTLQLLLN